VTEEYKKLCACPAWAPNAQKLHEAIRGYQWQTQAPVTLIRFAFCPWCGRELNFIQRDTLEILASYTGGDLAHARALAELAGLLGEDI
jgi:hypothetical protein